MSLPARGGARTRGWAGVRRGGAGVLALFLQFAPPMIPTTRAQSAPDKAAAQALFEQARGLLREGRAKEACPKLEESQQLDPGVGTLLHLGECYERLGRTASAWVTFLEAASTAQTSRQPDREKLAKQRAAALEVRLVWLRVEVPPEVQVPGLQVRQDGRVLPPERWGVEVPVDPGRHEVVASAPGFVEQRLVVQQDAPGHQALLIAPLKPVPDGQKGTPSASVSAPSASVSAPVASVRAPLTPSARAGVAPESSGPSAGRGYVALGLGTLGVLSLGAGSFFGLRALARQDDAEPRCDAQNFCDDEGLRARKDAIRAGNLSTLFFGVGLVGVGAGVTLWLTAPSAPSSVTFQLSPAGASLRGAF
jgi:hypothetical protein